ncbi:MAG: efflux RND transporter permease subunit [Myxococcales bacterium FL481]|nr:MAG: efflux RND transporter permease subunit [Myxococcales bacterium FL481]
MVGIYQPVARGAVRERYITLALSLAALIVTIGVVASGKIPFNFFPQIEGDLVVAQARLPYGAPLERTEKTRQVLAAALDETIAEYGAESVRGVFTRVGEEAPKQGPGGGSTETGSHLVAIEVGLVSSELRDFRAEAFGNAWGEAASELPFVESVTFSSSTGPGAGDAVAVQLVHADTEVLAEASVELDQQLRGYDALKNVRNEYTSGKPQLDYRLTSRARSLGLSATDVASQLRASFYGVEAIREQRGRNELRIVARLPRSERRSEYDLAQIMVRTPRGGHVPLGEVAAFDRGRAATAIRREDGRRSITVSAELAEGVPSPRPVLTDLQANVFEDLRQSYPGLEVGLVGQQREQQEAFGALGQGYLFALFVIFALLAVPFRSYLQPIIIMAVIPFGIVGAIVGHAVMGYGLSLMSIFGIVALSGVVVNDSLVLIDASNRERRLGKSALDAILTAGTLRFRPILLTSLTTFFGLMPMISETSVQAQFLIPMAISVAFGVLFVTVVVLLVVPALYMIVEDLRDLWAGDASTAPVGEPATPPAE